MACSIDNGYVFSCTDNNLYCQYECVSGYHKAISGWSSSTVYCDGLSGKWMITGYASTPCIKAPTTHPLKVQHENDDVINSVLVISASVTGGVVGLVLLLAFIWFCLRKQLAHPPTVAIPPGGANVMEDRQLEELCRERLSREQEDNTRRQNENIRGQNETNSESETNNRSIIFRLRRFFKITRNPYEAFRNTPEPPPYDAESFGPPTYEESERATHVTPASFQQEREPRVDLGQEQPP